MPKRARVFDRSVQVANLWVRDVSDHLLTEDRASAWDALRAVLHVLRDRLPLEAVLGLSAQSPLLIRGLLLEGWRPQDGPMPIRDPDAFLDAVTDRLPPDCPHAARDAVDAVLSVLDERLDPGEVEKIKAHLPDRLRRLWPPAAPARVGADPAPPERNASAGDDGPDVLAWGAYAGAVILVLGVLGVGLGVAAARVAGQADFAALASPWQGLRRLAIALTVAGAVLLVFSVLSASAAGGFARRWRRSGSASPRGQAHRS